MDLPAVEAVVPDLLRLAELELGEQLVVEAAELGGPGGGWVEVEEVADAGGAGDHQGEGAAAFGGGVGHDVVVALGDGGDGAGRGVDPHQVGAPFLGRAEDQGLAVAAPDRRRRVLAARRPLVAGQGGADVEVVVGGEVARGPAVGDEEVGLVVGARRLGARDGLQGESAAVRRLAEVGDLALDVGDLLGFVATGWGGGSAGGRGDGPEVAVRQAVVGLLLAGRSEEEALAVGRPLRGARREFAAGELAGFGQGAGGIAGNVDDPEVGRPLGVEEALAVGAVARLGDDADIAFAVGAGLRFLLRRLARPLALR